VDLSRPYSGIAPTVDGDVLVALAGTTRPLTGRQVSRLARRGSQTAVNRALDRLTAHGLVRREPAPPAMLYTLNRDHVGYRAVEALAGMRNLLLERLRGRFAQWAIRPVHASMFGSGARADGGVDSDVDIVVVRPRAVDEEDDRWQEQMSGLRTAVSAWSGNAASVVEMAEDELAGFVAANPPVLAEWRGDAVRLAGRSLAATIEAAT
jgi:DNA-binding transcriptional ArsR family regulator